MSENIQLASRWTVKKTGNVYEVIVLAGFDERSQDYRLRLVEIGPTANKYAAGDNRFSIGDEMTVDREWFDVRARKAAE